MVCREELKEGWKKRMQGQVFGGHLICPAAWRQDQATSALPQRNYLVISFAVCSRSVRTHLHTRTHTNTPCPLPFLPVTSTELRAFLVRTGLCRIITLELFKSVLFVRR